MRSLLLLASLASALAALADDEPVAGDLAKLQGLWRGKTGVNGAFTTTWTIEGRTVKFENLTESGKLIGGVSTIAQDQKARPHKTIDSLIVDRHGAEGGAPGVVLGIYEFVDADTIRICNGFAVRPEGFKAGQAAEKMLFTLKRVPPSERSP